MIGNPSRKWAKALQSPEGIRYFTNGVDFKVQPRQPARTTTDGERIEHGQMGPFPTLQAVDEFVKRVIEDCWADNPKPTQAWIDQAANNGITHYRSRPSNIDLHIIDPSMITRPRFSWEKPIKDTRRLNRRKEKLPTGYYITPNGLDAPEYKGPFNSRDDAELWLQWVIKS